MPRTHAIQEKRLDIEIILCTHTTKRIYYFEG